MSRYLGDRWEPFSSFSGIQMRLGILNFHFSKREALACLPRTPSRRLTGMGHDVHAASGQMAHHAVQAPEFLMGSTSGPVSSSPTPCRPPLTMLPYETVGPRSLLIAPHPRSPFSGPGRP